MKFRNHSLLLLILFSFLGKAQEQRLSLQQILDSAKVKHPALSRLKLESESAGYEKNYFFNPDPLDVSFSRGNLYGLTSDQAFQIRQNFGSPFSVRAKKRMFSTSFEYKLAEVQLNEILIFAEIKKAYFQCQFALEMNKLCTSEYESCLKIYNQFLKADSLNQKKLDRAIISQALMEADMKNRTAYNDLIKAQNKLLQASFLDIETLPSDSVFEIYEITVNSDKESRTPAHLYNNLSEIQYKLSQNQYELTKKAFYPSFFAGYTFNTINGQHGFNYWSVGMSLPIWAFKQTIEIKKAKLGTKISELKRLEDRSANDALTANLLTELNLYFERLNYYYDYALKQADDLISIAMEQVDTGTYNMTEVMFAIQKAYSIRRDYLQNILNYNVKAAEVETYAY